MEVPMEIDAAKDDLASVAFTAIKIVPTTIMAEMEDK